MERAIINAVKTAGWNARQERKFMNNSKTVYDNTHPNFYKTLAAAIKKAAERKDKKHGK